MEYLLTYEEELDIMYHFLSTNDKRIGKIKSIEFKKTQISDRNNPTGELLPREVDSIIINSKNSTHYIYKDSTAWDLILNIIKPKIREEKLKEIGI